MSDLLEFRFGSLQLLVFPKVKITIMSEIKKNVTKQLMAILKEDIAECSIILSSIDFAKVFSVSPLTLLASQISYCFPHSDIYLN